MKRIIFAITMLAVFSPAVPRAHAADVSVDFFYNNLSGGGWVEVADYGYCWQPEVAVSNTAWRPYSDGYWAYTDLGWTWVSYEDFGWATYHYGRWARLSGYGWVWVPGRNEDLEWGPAWVSWRTGGDYVGWAPLPPRSGGIGVSFGPGGVAISGRVDLDYDIGPAYYNFVSVRYIGEPVLRDRIVDVSHNVTYVNQTVNVTNITYKNKTVYNYGPDINVLNKSSIRPIQRLRLERQDNADVSAAAKSGGMTKVQGDILMVAAPAKITKSTQPIAPPKVKTKVTQAKIDRGWSSAGDPNAQTQLKEKMKTEDASKIPPPTGAPPVDGAAVGAAGQAAAGASTGAAPTELEKGKGKKGKRGEDQAAGAGATGVAPGEPATSADQMGTERGKNKGKGKGGQQGQPEAADSGAGAAGAASSTSGFDRERGKGKGKGKQGETPTMDATGPTGTTPDGSQTGLERNKGKRGQLQPTESTGGAPAGAEGSSLGGQDKRGKKVDQGAPGQSLNQPDDQADQGRGKRGKQFDQPGGNSALGAGQGPQGPAGAGGGGGKHKGRGQTEEPSNAQPAGAAAGSGEKRQGKGEGKKQKQKGEAVPEPTP